MARGHLAKLEPGGKKTASQMTEDIPAICIFVSCVALMPRLGLSLSPSKAEMRRENRIPERTWEALVWDVENQSPWCCHVLGSLGRKPLRGYGVRGDCCLPGFPVSAVAWPSGKQPLHQPQTWSPAALSPPFPGWLLEEVRKHPTKMLIQTSHPPWLTTENVSVMLSPGSA